MDGVSTGNATMSFHIHYMLQRPIAYNPMITGNDLNKNLVE
jgi:hypothetical protein